MEKTLLEKIADICRPKFCGDTSIVINARIKITGYTGDDAKYNGLTGITTHPFPFGNQTKDMVGIYLDAGQREVTIEGNRLNVEADRVFFLPTEADLIVMNYLK